MYYYRARPRVLVLGGGFAGLEAAFYARMRLPEHADITLISDQDHFLFKPGMIYIPFGMDPAKLKLNLEKPTSNKAIDFLCARVRDIDPISRNVQVEGYRPDDHEFHYDYLIIATGAGTRPEEIPGLRAFAHMAWIVEAMLEVRNAFGGLLEAARDERKRRVLFLLPPNNKHSGPLYELAFMLDTWLRRRKARNPVDITLATYEESYIQAFGPRLHEAIKGELHRRGMEGLIGHVVSHVERDRVYFENGNSLPYDLLVSFPAHAASTVYPALKADARGFIATDIGTRQVTDYPEIYAVGDAGDFPVKQAHLALMQADAAADHLSADVLGVQPQVRFEPVARYVMDQLDKATFAQVPMRTTGLPGRPVEVQTDSEQYKVGSSVAWRAGKKLMGMYLPWRFDGGNPFDVGLPWMGMEIGMNAMSDTLAD